MADLLRTPIQPSQQLHQSSSEESFHSVSEVHHPAPSASSTIPSKSTTTTSDPVSYVSQLHLHCQAHHLPAPDFQLTQHGEPHAPLFAGEVFIYSPNKDNIIAKASSSGYHSDDEGVEAGRWKTKRAAREGLAELVLLDLHIQAQVQQVQQEHSSPPNAENVERDDTEVDEKWNWIGRLQEFCQQHCAGALPSYEVHLLPEGGFSATCRIPNVVSKNEETAILGSFSSEQRPMPSKKAARMAAARQACWYLFGQGSMDSQGKCILKTLTPISSGQGDNQISSSAVITGSATASYPSGTTGTGQSHGWGRRVAILSQRLGLHGVQYHLTPTSSNSQGMWDGHATFPIPLGEDTRVQQVYGKANAKSELARGVWGKMVQIARERGFDVLVKREGSGDGDGEVESVELVAR